MIFLIVIFFHSALSIPECGVAITGSRIVGGNDTKGYHYPWFALLQMKRSATPACAGTLITSRHVLTAAHCFSTDTRTAYTPNEELFTVALGVYDRCDPREQTRKIFNVKNVYVHERYQDDGKFHDIAVMTLDGYADYTVACLPVQGLRDVTEPALLIGFGITDEGSNKAPCHMMEANVMKFSKNDCKNSDLPREDSTEPTVICAGAVQGGVDSCQGDSGGPLLIKTSSNRYIIAGIVSYGYGCGEPGLPGLYTDVSCYLSWIYDKTRRSTSDDFKKTTPTYISPRGDSIFPKPPYIFSFPGNIPTINFGHPSINNTQFNIPGQRINNSQSTSRPKFMDNRAIPRKNHKNQNLTIY